MHPVGVANAWRPGGRASGAAFLGAAAALFAATAAGTAAWSAWMSGMGGTSMAWMPQPGQSWPVVAASFLGMWAAMTAAMMLPSLTPTLWRYRAAMGRAAAGSRPELVAALLGLGYLSVWLVVGAVAFPAGAALAALAMGWAPAAGALPLAAGLAVLLAGCYQLTAAKARRLACCREAPAPGDPLPGTTAAAWRYGVRHGLRCVRCCGGLMAVVLVIGVTDVRAMAVVAAAITAERLAPAGVLVARAIGVVTIGAGALLIARAVGLS